MLSKNKLGQVHPVIVKPEAVPAPVIQKKTIGFLLRKAYQRNMAIWQSLTIDPQLTSVQAAALRVVYENGPCSLTVLGKGAAMDPATTRGVVERLRERQMISLSGDIADRRKVIVHLEKKGRTLVEDMVPTVEKISEATMGPLNLAERLALEFLLEKITASDDFGETN